jgi:hypothetical protein
LYPATDSPPGNIRSEDEWALHQAKYLEDSARGGAILTTPTEDGLICVPVLLLGIAPISALIAGIVFGGIHLARFTYLECIGKAIAYAIVCYVVLPFGLLTVAVGHLLLDVIALAVVKLAKHRLSRKQHP